MGERGHRQPPACESGNHSSPRFAMPSAARSRYDVHMFGLFARCLPKKANTFAPAIHGLLGRVEWPVPIEETVPAPSVAVELVRSCRVPWTDGRFDETSASNRSFGVTSNAAQILTAELPKIRNCILSDCGQMLRVAHRDRAPRLKRAAIMFTPTRRPWRIIFPAPFRGRRPITQVAAESQRPFTTMPKSKRHYLAWRPASTSTTFKRRSLLADRICWLFKVRASEAAHPEAPALIRGRISRGQVRHARGRA